MLRPMPKGSGIAVVGFLMPQVAGKGPVGQVRGIGAGMRSGVDVFGVAPNARFARRALHVIPIKIGITHGLAQPLIIPMEIQFIGRAHHHQIPRLLLLRELERWQVIALKRLERGCEEFLFHARHGLIEHTD